MGLLTRIYWGRVVLAAVAAGALWQLTSVRAPDTSLPLNADQTLLTNRPWIDRLPQSERDIISHLMFVDKDENRTGAVGRSSVWQQSAERFQWAPGTDALTLTFPQRNKTGTLRVAVSPCTAPEPMNLCLKIGTGRTATTLYSSTDWHLGSTDISAALTLLPIAPGADIEGTELRIFALME
jgi:hypothetical protein